MLSIFPPPPLSCLRPALAIPLLTFYPHCYCPPRRRDLRYIPMRKQNKVNMLQQSLDDPMLEAKVKGYIPGAVLRNLRPDSPEDEHWSNEVRNR